MVKRATHSGKKKRSQSPKRRRADAKYRLPAKHRWSGESGVAVPLYAIPIFILVMNEIDGENIDIAIYHESENDGSNAPVGIDSDVTAEITGCIKTFANFIAWMKCKKYVSMYFNYVTSEMGINVTSPSIHPCGFSDGDSYFSVDIWDLPPIVNQLKHARYHPAKHDPMGTLIGFMDNSEIGHHVSGFAIVSDSDWYIFESADMKLPLKFPEEPDERMKISLTVPHVIKCAKNRHLNACEHFGNDGISICPLCRMVPGKIVIHWEKCLAKSTGSETNLSGFHIDWQIDAWLAVSLCTYANHGWTVCIASNYYKLEQLESEDRTVDAIIGKYMNKIVNMNVRFCRNSVDLIEPYHIDTRPHGQVEHSSTLIYVLKRLLVRNDGSPIIVYDENPDVIMKANSIAAANDTSIITASVENDVRICYRLPETYSIHNGIVMPAKYCDRSFPDDRETKPYLKWQTQ